MNIGTPATEVETAASRSLLTALLLAAAPGILFGTVLGIAIALLLHSVRPGFSGNAAIRRAATNLFRRNPGRAARVSSS